MQRESAGQEMSERLRKVAENSRRDAVSYFNSNPIQKAAIDIAERENAGGK